MMLWCQLMLELCILICNLCCMCGSFSETRTCVILRAFGMCRMLFSAGWGFWNYRFAPRLKVGAANKWAKSQEVVIRTGRVAYQCWRREGVTFSRFASHAYVCAANSLAESQGFLRSSVRAANQDGAACCWCWDIFKSSKMHNFLTVGLFDVLFWAKRTL